MTNKRYSISTHPQGSQEWMNDRCGKATGSRANDILAKIKTGEAAARRDYKVQLAVERLTGTPTENGFVSKDMQFGIEQEPMARMAYEADTGMIVEESGFMSLYDYAAGCSVDGIVSGGGILEIKCPKSATHISYILANRIPPAYEPQLIHNLWVTGEPFADFVSFDPRMPPHLQLFKARMERDEVKILAYQEEVLLFLDEVSFLVKKLSGGTP